MINILYYVGVSIFAIYLWNDASEQHKDNLFYLAVICSQVGFYILSKKLDSLKAKISQLETQEDSSVKQLNKD
ncbi:hypothetical protein NBRC116592_29170 [Colwellia sp. KU-HH00111]